MKRATLPILLVFTFACWSGDDVKPAVTSRVNTESTAALPACNGTVGIVGQPVRIEVRASWVTTSCMCEYTTRDNGWSCSNQLHCESSYDLGGPNRDRCDTIRTDTVSIRGIDASVDSTSIDCSAEVEPTAAVDVT